MKKRIGKRIITSFDDEQAVIAFRYNMPFLTTREKVAVMERLLIKKSISNKKLINSIPTAELIKVLAEREGVVYSHSVNIHILMVHDCFVGAGDSMVENMAGQL